MNSDLKKISDLDGRVALITGASTHGIGHSSAEMLAAYGAKVFIIARRIKQLEEAVKGINEKYGEGTAAYFAADVSDESACKAAVEACVKTFSRLDIMVLCAGMAGPNPKSLEEEFDTDAYRKVLGVNLDGTFFMIKYGWKECAKNGVGSIIMTDSLAGFKASGHAPYTASKGAVRAWTKYFGKKLAAVNVRVNSIVPGLTETEMVHPKGMDDVFEKYVAPGAKNIPLGRLGQPEDMAAAVLYLAGDAAGWVTGHCLVIDGGELCG